MDNVAQFPHHHRGNAGTEIKSESLIETESISDRASPTNAFQLQKHHKSPNRTGITGKSKVVATAGSRGGSSDYWSMRTFSELVASSNRERWSFDSDNLTSSSSKVTSSNPQLTTVVTPCQQSCRVCSKLLTEYCVVAVLVCGHLYHDECLEKMTSLTDHYDPPCPVCTRGKKSAAKIFKRAETKARNKLSRIGVADSKEHGDAICDRQKGAGGASSSIKHSSGRPFLRRHFSIGRPSRSISESESNRKKGF